MAAGEVLLDVQRVGLTLGGNAILRDCSFQVVDRVRPGVVTGQIVALLGPSGVGKTRLLRIIAGLDPPDVGRVTGYKGAPLLEGEVGVVFQHYPLLRHRRVLGNLETAGRMNGMGAAEARSRAAHLLERFGLTARAQLYPAQLSGGQRQRAAIAQQLMKPKTFLLLDEPFSGLDPSALGDVIKLLVEVANMDELNTLVIVTHDIEAAVVCTDAVMLLGREPNALGKGVGPAKIQRSVDLVAEGLAYQDDVEQLPRFAELVRDLKDGFRRL